MTHPPILAVLEGYYDAAPRPAATTEEVGPFTLFVRSDPAGWPFYARPRLGLDVSFTATDVEKVRARQRELGIPEAIEWVHQATPSLLDAVRATGMRVTECPLLVLPADTPPVPDRADDVTTRVLAPEAADLPDVVGAIGAGFRGSNVYESHEPGPRVAQMRAGLLVMVGAYDARGRVIGGGSHSPRDGTTELTGIAVLPRARRRGVGAAITRTLVHDAARRGAETVFLSAQDDAVARVYERVGFRRVGTACVAEADDE